MADVCEESAKAEEIEIEEEENDSPEYVDQRYAELQRTKNRAIPLEEYCRRRGIKL